MIEHRLLTPGNYRRMPWKNGGGLTTEILTYPPRASLDGFAWRASVADVTRDGPFSHFEGIDRILVLLRGSGIRLAGSGPAMELRALHEPLAFRGEERIECTLIDGAVRDFNLMVRRDAARGSVRVVQNGGERLPPSRFTLCYAVVDACECLIAGHPPIGIAGDHALLLEDSEARETPAINPLAADSIAIVASIDLL